MATGRFIDLTGLEFGRLTVMNTTGKDKHGRYLWKCKCVCGNEKTIATYILKSGHTKSCGCFRKEVTSERAKKHGKRHSAEYEIWCGIMQRCTNPNHIAYKNYGGRNITICDRWKDFSLFIEDMGERPTPSHSVERNENEKGYTPENCRWATREEQARNTRIRKSNTSGVQGVNWHKSSGKWDVRISYKGKRISLGSYTSLEEATKIRRNAEVKYWNKSS